MSGLLDINTVLLENYSFHGMSSISSRDRPNTKVCAEIAKVDMWHSIHLYFIESKSGGTENKQQFMDVGNTSFLSITKVKQRWSRLLPG
jgi:hypothetical protein